MIWDSRKKNGVPELVTVNAIGGASIITLNSGRTPSTTPKKSIMFHCCLVADNSC